MNFKKQVIDKMPHCYSNASSIIKNKSVLFFGAEDKGCLKKYYGENFANCLTLWDEYENLGGIMSIVPLECRDDILFVSTGFFSIMEAEKSKIFILKMKDNKFEKREIAEIDNLHRFGIINSENRLYLVASTIHNGKDDMADWSRAGKILVSELPSDLNSDFYCELKVIKDDLHLNHGLNIAKLNGKNVCLIASQSGGFILSPPENFKTWEFKEIFNFPVSDILPIDIDSDGEDELAIIHPVHGNKCGIFKNTDGIWKLLYEPIKELSFYHGIATGKLKGTPTVAFGAREGDMDLFIIQYDNEKKEYFTTLIDSGVGPMSLSIHNSPSGNDMILSANSTIQELAIYIAE